MKVHPSVHSWDTGAVHVFDGGLKLINSKTELLILKQVFTNDSVNSSIAIKNN